MKHSNHAQHFIGVVTYYGEYLPNTEPHVIASNETEAHSKCLDWCKGMNPAHLSIVVYPYVNGYSN